MKDESFALIDGVYTHSFPGLIRRNLWGE